MAELPTTQPVASEPNGAAQPAPAASTSAPALEDLDALLSRYSEDTSTPANQPAPTPTKPAQQPKADEPALMDRVNRLVERQEADDRARQVQDHTVAIESAAKAIKGDLPDSAATLKQARAWMKDEADNDPRIQRAYKNRGADPQGWQKVLDAMHRQFVKETKRPDAAVTEDREAVTAAVRGAQTSPPPSKEPDMKSMSDAELRKFNQDKYGYSPKF